MLVDSHCHLDFPDFADELDAVVARARDAGIGRMVTISTRVRRHDELLAIADRFAEVFCSVGTHPHYAHEELDVTAADLVVRTRNPKVVAIGEAGLDYHYDRSPRQDQERGFRTHIAGGARDRAAASDPFAQCRRRHCSHSRGRNGAGRLPCRAALFHRRSRPCPPRDCAWALHLVHRHPDLQELGRTARHCRRAAGGPHPGRNRRAVSRAKSVSRQTQRAGLCGRNRQSAGGNARRLL